MTDITLGGNLPKMEQHNGLDAIADELVKDPSARRFAVVMIDAQKLVTKVDDGEVSPVLRIRRIEPATRAEDVKELTEILDRLTQDRMGMLPIEAPDDDEGEQETDPKKK
jgi:hypothetical protein